jgi:hypothetical protein
MLDHDPLQFITHFRDHLARHDKPLFFLFGAGTSCAVNIAPPAKGGAPRGFKPLIPAVAQLTILCKDAAAKLGAVFTSAWSAIETECPTGPGHPNIEDILSRIRLKIESLGKSDKACGLMRDQLVELETCIAKVILQQVSPEIDTLPDRIPHDQFADWLRRRHSLRAIEIFTPNYDVLIERSLELAKLPVFDGFVGSYQPFFLVDTVERPETMPPAEWTRVWKIHGSINWTLDRDRLGGTRIARSLSPGSTQLILPSHLKYDESKKQPYLAMLNRLGRVMDQEDALLVTCGYSFSDEHINATILTALQSRRRAHVIGLSYSDILPDTPISKIATNLQNLLLVGQEHAIISGQYGKWSEPSDPKAITPAAYRPPEKDSAGKEFGPRVLLGDFNVFCDFLSSMH